MNLSRVHALLFLLLGVGIHSSKESPSFKSEQGRLPLGLNKEGSGSDSGSGSGSGLGVNLNASFLSPEHPRGVVGTSSFLELKGGNEFISIRLTKQDIPEKKISTYYGSVRLGEQPESTINVLFDTGSSEFWVPYESCKTPQCQKHNTYKKSSSFRYKYDQRGLPSVLEVNYLSGKILGFDGYETVKLGKDLTIPKTNIAFATNITIPILEDFKWDGIIGLGFENEDSRKRGIKTFLDHVVDSKVLSDRNYKNLFGYYLSDGGGYITLGGIDQSLKRTPQEDFVWAPVSTEMGFWTIDILGVRKEKMPLTEDNKKDELVVKYEGFHDGGKKSIVDTGTFLMYAPKKTMESYLSDLKIDSCDQKKDLPYLIFQIRAKPTHALKGPTIIELALSPEDYVIEYLDQANATRECFLGIEADEQYEEDHIEGWTLGQVFLKSFYTIFDKDNMQIGFVRSKKNPTNLTYENKSFVNLRTAKKKQSYNGPL